MSEMFRPPINRAMRIIDRAFFQKDVGISAARIFDVRNISKLKDELHKSRDLLQLRQLQQIRPDPFFDPLNASRKCMLLKPHVKHDDQSTWSDTIKSLVTAENISVIPYKLHLDYDFWSANDIISAVLPEDAQDEVPRGFAQVGHIAHLNLNEHYLPYKTLIAQVLLDKNPSLRTAVNKVDTLAAENQFRVLDYELLAGEDNLIVETTQSSCIFRFDYSKVFWNTRLSNEHERLVSTFNTGDAVCDVMAGVGPFAIPAGKKGVFVYASDLNPDCFKSLQDAIRLNKTEGYVEAFNEDGHKFIPRSVMYLLESNPILKKEVDISGTERKRLNIGKAKVTAVAELKRPRTFSHYVMNLPSTAIYFLPDFIGLYAGHEDLFQPKSHRKMPLIHVYCFAPKIDEEGKEFVHNLISQRISEKIDFAIDPQNHELQITDVRDVAPHKRQYCATFRLPQEVAFGSRLRFSDNI